MVKRHLKRINAPKTWPIKRKDNLFIRRPFPTGNPLDNSLPLLVLFRDVLKKVKTTHELNYVLNYKGVYLNGRRLRSSKHGVGLMDVVSIPETEENFRILINETGYLEAVQIGEEEANIIPLMIKSKTKLKGNRFQLNFFNGNNMLVDKDKYKTGDVLMYDFINKKITEHLRLDKGKLVYFTRGRYIGKTAQVEEIKKNSIVYKKDGETFEVPKSSARDYTFLIGTETPSIKLAD